MNQPKLSVIIPCFNEATTIAQVVHEAVGVTASEGGVEVVVVDDGSTDGTADVLARLPSSPQLHLVRHERNRGKGAAVRSGLAVATGEYSLVRDADLEYETKDISALLNYVVAHRVDVVFGSRNLIKNQSASHLFYWGGRLVTLVANVLYHQRLTDEPTGYKLVRTGLLRTLDLQAEGFEFCPEVTAKLARLGYVIPEIPITYHPRSARQGKKIRVRDGWWAVVALVRYRWWLPRDHFNLLDRFIRWLRVRQALAAAPAGGRVLDLGCGPGAYLYYYLRRSGMTNQYLGVDRRTPSAYLPPGSFVEHDLGLGSRLPIEPGCYDRVYLLALVEHVPSPQQLVAEAYRALAPGGKLVLTTPAPQSRLVLEALAGLRLISHDEIEEHEHYYTPVELQALLAAAGAPASQVACHRFELGLNLLVVASK